MRVHIGFHFARDCNPALQSETLKYNRSPTFQCASTEVCTVLHALRPIFEYRIVTKRCSADDESAPIHSFFTSPTASTAVISPSRQPSPQAYRPSYMLLAHPARTNVKNTAEINSLNFFMKNSIKKLPRAITLGNTSLQKKTCSRCLAGGIHLRDDLRACCDFEAALGFKLVP